jgi:hypothetical protein
MTDKTGEIQLSGGEMLVKYCRNDNQKPWDARTYQIIPEGLNEKYHLPIGVVSS